jgi:hypothetical protein
VPARSHVLLILLLLGALAVPGAALGQSAGDEQYSDPFGGDQPQGQEQQEAPAQQPETAADPGDEPVAAAPAEPSDEVASPADSSDPSLPVTGLPVLGMLLVGAGMLAAGAVVRRRA